MISKQKSEAFKLNVQVLFLQNSSRYSYKTSWKTTASNYMHFRVMHKLFKVMQDEEISDLIKEKSRIRLVLRNSSQLDWTFFPKGHNVLHVLSLDSLIYQECFPEYSLKSSVNILLFSLLSKQFSADFVS